MTIRQPRLLDANLREVNRLTPVKLSLNQRLMSLSTAELLLPHDAPPTPARTLIELYDENGSAGIFRVKKVEETIGLTRKVTLEHGLCTLRDSVVPAQSFVNSLRGALGKLLACQTRPLWALGKVEAPEVLKIVFSTEYTDLFTALQALLGLLPDGYALDFDQHSTPWLLHLRHLTNTPFCEGRLSRNLQSVRVDTDSSRLCTRVYPFGAEFRTGRISLRPLSGRDFLQAETADELGVVSRTIETNDVFDAPTLRDVAQMYLTRHDRPDVTITVSAADLSTVTGEAMDHFLPGRMCRLCLPDMGLTLSERILAVSRPDVYGAPGQVLLTLSNRLKRQSESAEIAELARQVSARKLLGGTVTEVELSNHANGSFNSPVVHYFDLTEWAAVLDVRVSFQADTGATIRDIRVDAIHPEDEVWRSGSFSALPYLKRDELGQIIRGQHRVVISPYGSDASAECGVSSTITLTVIPTSSS